MGRKRKLLFLMAAAACLLVLAAVHLIRPLAYAFKDQLAQAASRELGVDVVFGQIGLAAAPGLELSMRGLGARKDGAEALGLKELRVKPDLPLLLRGKLRLTRVTLVEPVVSVVRRKDGSFNFFGRKRATSGKGAAIAKLVVHKGRLVYTDEKSGRRVEADGLELNLNNFSYGGKAADGPAKKLFFTGEVGCSELRTEGLDLKGLSLWASAGRGVFNLTPFSFTAAGVSGGGSLRADLASGTPAYRLSYASEKFSLEALLPVLYAGDSVWKDLRGTAGIRADLAAAGTSPDELRRSLAGTILLDGTDLRLPAPKGGRDLLRAGTAAVTLDAALFSAPGTRIKRVSLSAPAVFLRRGAGRETKRAGRPAAGKTVLIDELEARGGSFTYADEKGAALAASENVSLALKGFSYVPGAGGGPAAGYSFTGEIRCSTLAFAGVVSTGVVSGVTAGNGVFDLAPLRAWLFRGEGGGRLKADLSTPVPGYKLAYTLREFRLGEFLTAFSGGKAGPQDIKGRAELTVDVSARGRSAGELKRALAGRVALSGKKMALPRIDVDEVITKYVRSQNFNLLDAGAFLLAGPLGPAVTKSYNFADAGLSRGRNGVILGLSSVWNVKGGTARAEDVALATARYRLALKGGLDLADGHFDGVTVAVLDKGGCAAYSQNIQGSFNRPQIGKITMLESLVGPVLGVLETMGKLIPGGKCEVFYKGSVPQPD